MKMSRESTVADDSLPKIPRGTNQKLRADSEEVRGRGEGCSEHFFDSKFHFHENFRIFLIKLGYHI